jgi:hypothetical protein
MKINTREFKNIVRSIIKEEMEKVEEDLGIGTSVDYKYAKGFGDIEKEPSEDIETSEKPKSLMNSVRAFMKRLKMQGFSEKDVKSALDNL